MTFREWQFRWAKPESGAVIRSFEALIETGDSCFSAARVGGVPLWSHRLARDVALREAVEVNA